MDVDDLFGAFDGAEKVNDVREAVEPSGKRKAVDEGGGSKRQALAQEERAKRDSDPAASAVVEGSVALKEGEESSTVREDGTLLKSVRIAGQHHVLIFPNNHVQCTPYIVGLSIVWMLTTPTGTLEDLKLYSSRR